VTVGLHEVPWQNARRQREGWHSKEREQARPSLHAAQPRSLVFRYFSKYHNDMKQQSVFKALADPTRRSILRRLRKGSQTAGALAEAFPITRASLSHHFGILKAADLVRTERRGQHIVYSLNASVMEEVAALFMDLFGSGGGADGNDGNGGDNDKETESS